MHAILLLCEYLDERQKEQAASRVWVSGPPRPRSPYNFPVSGITPKVKPIEPTSVALAIGARLVVPIVVAEAQSLKFPI